MGRHWKFGTTADVGIGASASTPEGLFAELGCGLFSLITDLREIRQVESRRVAVSSPSPEGLLVRFLSELLFLTDTEGMLFSGFTVTLEGQPPRKLRAELWGETWDETRHPRRVNVKAITMHRLELDLVRCRARVIVDI
jgi:SHS2 domain-containing protein